MQIQQIFQFNKNINLIKNNDRTITNPISKESGTNVNLNNLQNYSYQVSFRGATVETIAKMEKLVKSKGYKFEDLKKLFDELSNTAKENVNGLVNKFKNEGLTFEEYLPNAIQSNLFYKKPETIEKNVRELVKKFEKEGLNIGDYIKACVKQPPLFCLSPETIEEHIRAYMYVDKNNIGIKDKNIMDKILNKNLAYSTSLIYLQSIVLPQLKKQSTEIAKWSTSGLKPNLKKYFENHPDKKFTIKILDDEMSGNFIKTIKEFCQKDLGRDDMFELTIIPSKI